MNSHYCSTPYKLNIKLKKLNRNRNITKSVDLNRLYNNLSQSIPLITNQFCYLKKKTKALNRTLSNIPIINNNINYINTNRTNFNSFSQSGITSPIKLNNYNDFSYISPKPEFNQYNKANNNFLNYKNDIKYKDKNNKINKSNSQMKLNFKYRSNKNNNYPIKSNHFRNNSFIDIMNNNNYYINQNDNNNDNKEDCFTFKNNCMTNNNKNDIDKEIYEQQYQKLNQQICEKDKIINKMKGIINDNYDKIDKKNKENSMLQSEIIELKSRTNESNYNNFKNSNIYENSRYNYNNKDNNNYNFNHNNNNNIYNNNNNYNYNYNNNYMSENSNNNVNRRKNYSLNYQNYNGCNGYKVGSYNSNNINEPKNEKMDEKWEEIRILNKKMDNLLQKNGKNTRKYEKNRRKYNY